jgi:hypothetical protein
MTSGFDDVSAVTDGAALVVVNNPCDKPVPQDGLAVREPWMRVGSEGQTGKGRSRVSI